MRYYWQAPMLFTATVGAVSLPRSSVAKDKWWVHATAIIASRYGSYTTAEPRWQAAKAAQEAYAAQVEDLDRFGVYYYEQLEQLAEMVLAEFRKAFPEREIEFASCVRDATSSEFTREVLKALNEHLV